GSGIERAGALVGADRRDVNEARAMRACRLRHAFGAERLYRLEALAAALEQDTNEVDHDIGVARRRLDRFGIAQVGLHGVNLAHASERLQMPGEIGPPHRDADPVALLAQGANDMAAKEAGSAEDGDERVDACLGDHAALGLAGAWADMASARKRRASAGYGIAATRYRDRRRRFDKAKRPAIRNR